MLVPPQHLVPLLLSPSPPPPWPRSGPPKAAPPLPQAEFPSHPTISASTASAPSAPYPHLSPSKIATSPWPSDLAAPDKYPRPAARIYPPSSPRAANPRDRFHPH